MATIHLTGPSNLDPARLSAMRLAALNCLAVGKAGKPDLVRDARASLGETP